MNTLILLAAGRGERIHGFLSDKSTAVLKGKPILHYSLEAFAEANCFDQALIAYRDSDQKKCLEAIVQAIDLKDLKIDFVQGGESRADSVYNALSVLANQQPKPSKDDRVAIHDVARPLIRSQFIKDLIDHAEKYPNVIPTNKMIDSIKLVAFNPSSEGSGKIQKHLDRSHLRAAQTPQIFNFAKLYFAYKALEEDRASYTDDASILESFGESVYYLENPNPNPKITTKSDWDYILYLLNENAL